MPVLWKTPTAQKMKFFINDFFSKYQIRRKLPIWSHLLKESLMENFIFQAVKGGCIIGFLGNFLRVSGKNDQQRSFPRPFNEEYTWCFCRAIIPKLKIS